MARPHVLEPSPIALIGAALAIISNFLAWDDGTGIAYDDSSKVPFEFLWDKHASGAWSLRTTCSFSRARWVWSG